MGGEILYLDSSALVKLVLPEAESAALLNPPARCRAKKSQITAGPFGSLGLGPKIRG